MVKVIFPIAIEDPGSDSTELVEVKLQGIRSLSRFNKRGFGGFMKLKTQSLIGLIVLSIVDAIIPIPVVGLILILVILQRPPWFQRLVQELYEA
jgi:hypothetical protein